ncbi:unnamed protein product [Rotaria sp. Silwood1]|nr:unnamed protein product [Rotaria sp. Silwood1]CAF1552272.1 unnamed protein product [Rotaria sp. Silwood1]
MDEEQSKKTASKSTTTLNIIQPRRRMVQNYLLIWIDGSIDETNPDCQNTLARLRSVVNEVTLCTEPTQCIKCLNDMKDEKILIISSGTVGQHLVPQIHDMSQLHTIYIFCSNESRHKAWVKNWSKIEGIFTSIEPICESLKQVARRCDHNTIPMSFVPKRMIPTTASNQQNLDQLEPSYMYSLLFKEIILEIDEDDAKPLEDLVAYCRQQNVSESELKNFQDQYYLKSPVWLYTCGIFLYKMLNCALRSLDTEAMIKMGFFIRNLHRQLQQLQQEQSGANKKQFIVYRGQGFSKQDFEHLLDTKGGLLSFNNFLSTSKDKHVALAFAPSTSHKDKDIVGVLFKMTINPSKISTSSTPFALINDCSNFSEEQEILFSMHTVFRVGEIQQTANNRYLWEVQLTLTDVNDPQLAALTKRIREEIDGTGWYRMGKLMLKMGDFNQAEELYNGLLKNDSSDSDRAYIYHQLGCLKRDQGKYKEAASFDEKTLEIERKTLQEDHPSLAPTYTNIGLTYADMGDYSKALEFYDKALKIHEKAVPPNHLDSATSYNNIGVTYENMGDYSKALEFYYKALKIYEKTLPPNHPDLAKSYSNISATHDSMDEYSKALHFYDKALKIKEKTLPPNHPSLAISYNNIGVTYKNMGDYSKALEFYDKALKIKEKTLRPNHPSLAASYSNIGMAYSGMGDYLKALTFYNKDLEITKKSLPPNHPDLATSYNNIGVTYNNMGDYSKALEFYNKALKINEKALPPNYPSLAIAYKNIGMAYSGMGDYSRALTYLEKTLATEQKSLPPTHPSIETTINKINSIKKKL